MRRSVIFTAAVFVMLAPFLHGLVTDSSDPGTDLLKQL